MNRAIYAIMTATTLLLGTIAMAMPYQEAEASHTHIQVIASMMKNGIGTGDAYNAFVTCSSDTCDVDVDIPMNRDEKRFDKWCGDTKVVIVPGGTGYIDVQCFGNGPWSINLNVRTTDSGKVITSHGTDVTVNVSAI
jgi:hypothetical protein